VHRRAGDVSVDVLHFDLEGPVSAVRPPLAEPSELEHALLRRDPELLARATFDEVRMERSIHPSYVAVEPPLEVVECRRPHRGVIAFPA
jgi:hypothetical protein